MLPGIVKCCYSVSAEVLTLQNWTKFHNIPQKTLNVKRAKKKRFSIVEMLWHWYNQVRFIHWKN